MNTRILEEIGLSKGESKIYLALVEIGTSTTGPIAKHSGVSASKVYKILDKLSKKGLVSHVLIGKTKHFKSANPKNVLNLIKQKKQSLQEKEKEFTTLLPELQMKLKISQKKAQAEIYEEFKGLKTAFDEILDTLKKGEELYTIGIPPAKGIIQRYFIHFFKKQAKIGFKIKAIFNESARKTARERKNKYATFRFMPEGIVTPSIINIYKDKTIINVRSEAEQIFTFVITSKETAKSFKEYFKILWKQAKQ
ncbi:hypothetical protein JW851_00650 [Candidatus Woesearchaeota archaeon]|nr:hypothetical protein [Candidatus Woesearchaeota archaeon]